MIAEIAVIPQIAESGRTVIADAVAEIEALGLRYEVGVSGTAVEGELAAILEAVQAIERRLRADRVPRALIELRLQLEPHPETLEHQLEGMPMGGAAR